MSNYPDFFIVGAPKSGTTSLSKMLQNTPGVFIPEIKEPHYFGLDMPGPHGNYIRGMEEYQALYEGKESLTTGDASVWYYRSLSAPKEIRTVKADAKIIIMLRAPADVLESLYIHKVYSGDEERDDYRQAFQDSKPLNDARLRWTAWGLDYKNMPKWAHWMPNWINEFGMNNIKILIFEDFCSNPEACYEDVCKFLNVEPSRRALEYSHENMSKKNRPVWLQRLIALIPLQMKFLASKGILSELRNYLILYIAKFSKHRKLVFDDDFKRQLSIIYEEDIVYVEKLLSRKMSFWRKN